jgi:DNA adenine methylase Dam
MPTSFQPVIKWSGSKRFQANTIAKFFPRFKTYYEPFLGGGSVLFATDPIMAVCGDICIPLIELWKAIQRSPEALIDSYSQDWENLQTEGYTYFYEVRDRFNRNPNPEDLLFLSRTCVNGLIRFNGKGQFNNSLHHTRKGILPDRLGQIIRQWSTRVRRVDFAAGDYRDTTKSATEGDFVYLDPPYFNTKGRYYGKIDFEDFVRYLTELNDRGVRFALSFDGSRGSKEFMVEFPRELFKRSFLIRNGNSTFMKVMDGRVESVREALYLNWHDDSGDLLTHFSVEGLNKTSSSDANLVVLNRSE